MTLRGCPPSYPERQWQGRRSTYIGTCDGRIANAYPLPFLKPGRLIPGSSSILPAFHWVATDAGQPGTSVTSWPARRGPTLVVPDWAGPQVPGVVDADGSVRWDFDATGYLQQYLNFRNDDVSSLGIATGFTVFMVFEMAADPGPPALPGDVQNHANFIDLWLGSGDSSDGALNGGMEIAIANTRRSTALGELDDNIQGDVILNTFHNSVPYANGGQQFAHSFSSGPGPIWPMGALATGGQQFIELGGTLGQANEYCRLDGADLTGAPPGPGTLIGPWKIREPDVITYGKTGHPVRIWEIVMFGTQLTGDVLTQWRQEFVTKYGVSV